MRNFIICNVFTLILMVLMVNANDKLDLKNDANSKKEDLKQVVKSLIKGESEDSAKPELNVLQKPMLLNSETGENSMKHMKLSPESENISKDDSALYKVTGANDNKYNEALSPPLLPLENHSALAHHNTVNSSTSHPTASIKNVNNHRLPITNEQSKKLISSGNNENASLNVPVTSKIPETSAQIHDQNSSPNSNKTEEMIIGAFDVEAVRDIINSMIVENTESITIEDSTEASPEELTAIVLVEDLESDGFDSANDEPESESSTGLFTEMLEENALNEVMNVLENLNSNAIFLPNISSLPLDKFEFFVFNETSNIACILLSMDLSLRISYESKDQKYITKDYQLPIAIEVTGHCANNNSFMTLSWADSSNIDQQNSITFDFANDNSSFYVDSVHVNISLNSHNFPNAKDAFIAGNSSTNLKLFSAPVQNGIYICPVETKITCGNIVATISNVTLIAFNEHQELSNRQEKHCSFNSWEGQEVNIAGIIGGIIGVLILLAIAVALVSWYRRRSDITLRSELP